MDAKRLSSIRDQSQRANRLWPPVVTEFESSTQYMKRLTAVAVSHILRLRQYYSDRYFDEHSLDYLQIKILVDDCERYAECHCILCLLLSKLSILGVFLN